MLSVYTCRVRVCVLNCNKGFLKIDHMRIIIRGRWTFVTAFYLVTFCPHWTLTGTHRFLSLRLCDCKGHFGFVFDSHPRYVHGYTSVKYFLPVIRDLLIFDYYVSVTCQRKVNGR